MGPDLYHGFRASILQFCQGALGHSDPLRARVAPVTNANHGAASPFDTRGFGGWIILFLFVRKPGPSPREAKSTVTSGVARRHRHFLLFDS